MTITHWVECCSCSRWRILPRGQQLGGATRWKCHQNGRKCHEPEDQLDPPFHGVRSSMRPGLRRTSSPTKPSQHNWIVCCDCTKWRVLCPAEPAATDRWTCTQFGRRCGQQDDREVCDIPDAVRDRFACSSANAKATSSTVQAERSKRQRQSKQPAANSKQPAATSQQPAATSKRQQQSKQQAATSKQQAATSKQQAATSKQPAATSKRSAANSKQSAATSKRQQQSKQQAATSEQQAATSKQPAATSKRSAANSKQSAATSKRQKQSKQPAATSERQRQSKQPAATSKQPAAHQWSNCPNESTVAVQCNKVEAEYDLSSNTVHYQRRQFSPAAFERGPAAGTARRWRDTIHIVQRSELSATTATLGEWMEMSPRQRCTHLHGNPTHLNIAAAATADAKSEPKDSRAPCARCGTLTQPAISGRLLCSDCTRTRQPGRVQHGSKSKEPEDTTEYDQWLRCDGCDEWHVVSDQTKDAVVKLRNAKNKLRQWRCGPCAEALEQWSSKEIQPHFSGTKRRFIHRNLAPRRGRCSVVVVGAGVAGLVAARQLAGDCQVVVVEARNRMGGRVHTVNNWGGSEEGGGMDGLVVDMGASFIHGCFDENPIYRMSKGCGALVNAAAGGYSVGWGPTGKWYDHRTGLPLKPNSLKQGNEIFTRAWTKVMQMAEELREAEAIVDWVQCDDCSKWRSSSAEQLDGKAGWRCTDGGFDCTDPELDQDSISGLLGGDMSVQCALTEALEEIKSQRDLTQLEQDIVASMQVVAWAFVAPLSQLSLGSVDSSEFRSLKLQSNRSPSASSIPPMPSPDLRMQENLRMLKQKWGKHRGAVISHNLHSTKVESSKPQQLGSAIHNSSSLRVPGCVKQEEKAFCPFDLLQEQSSKLVDPIPTYRPDVAQSLCVPFVHIYPWSANCSSTGVPVEPNRAYAAQKYCSQIEDCDTGFVNISVEAASPGMTKGGQEEQAMPESNTSICAPQQRHAEGQPFEASAGQSHKNKTGYLGVDRLKSGRFSAKIYKAGKRVWLGVHETIEDAAAAVRAGRHIQAMPSTSGVGSQMDAEGSASKQHSDFVAGSDATLAAHQMTECGASKQCTPLKLDAHSVIGTPRTLCLKQQRKCASNRVDDGKQSAPLIHSSLKGTKRMQTDVSSSTRKRRKPQRSKSYQRDGLVSSGYANFLVKQLVYGPPVNNAAPSNQPLDIRLNTAVTEIIHGDDGCRVLLKGGTELQCDFVVVTLPLGVLQASIRKDTADPQADGLIRFEPPLSQRKQLAIERLGFGIENKVVIRFLSKFWPDEPFLQCTDCRFRFINLDFYGKSDVVVAHVGPPFANGFDGLSDDEVVTLVAGTFASMFGHSTPKIVASTVTHWEKDAYARGSYSFAKVGSDVEKESAALAAAEGRLYFAGEACSSRHMQCVHGAYISGKEAATDILEWVDKGFA